MPVKITTVKELKELLKKIPDYADVEHTNFDDDEIKKGVEVNYSEGTSWSNPYICFES